MSDASEPVNPTPVTTTTTQTGTAPTVTVWSDQPVVKVENVVTPGLQTSEGRLVYALVGVLQLVTALWAVLLGTGAIHPSEAVAAAVPGVAQVVSAWLVSQYSEDRTAVKAAALGS